MRKDGNIRKAENPQEGTFQLQGDPCVWPRQPISRPPLSTYSLQTDLFSSRISKTVVFGSLFFKKLKKKKEKKLNNLSSTLPLGMLHRDSNYAGRQPQVLVLGFQVLVFVFFNFYQSTISIQKLSVWISSPLAFSSLNNRRKPCQIKTAFPTPLRRKHI